LKYPLFCAKKNGAWVPWMIQSIMILTFLVSADEAPAEASIMTSEDRNARANMHDLRRCSTIIVPSPTRA
jgi:hypothetical protein